MNNQNVYLHKIATVVPENCYDQQFVLNYLLKLQGTTSKKQSFLKRIYQNSGIDKRYTVIPDYDKKPEEHIFFPKNVELEPEPTTRERNAFFVKEANRLSYQAVEDLLNQNEQFDQKKITHLITVSCTGFSAPGFDYYLIKEIDLNPSIQRFHIGFMGCFGAFPALRLAQHICRSEPTARVLMVNVELCSLHFQKNLNWIQSLPRHYLLMVSVRL